MDLIVSVPDHCLSFFLLRQASAYIHISYSKTSTRMKVVARKEKDFSFMYLVISLLVLRAGCGIRLYKSLIIAYLFT